MLNVYEQVERNKRRSNLIVFFFAIFITAFFYFFGRILGYGSDFIGWALILAGVTSFVGYWYSDRIVLAVAGAHPTSKDESFNFYTAVENMSLAAGIPMPKVYLIDDPAPNAFATGRDINHAVIAATTGLVEKLNKTEMEAVVAHEISHIRNYDMRLASIVAVLIGAVTLIADSLWRGGLIRRRRRDDEGGGSLIFVLGLVFVLLSPLIGKLIQLALSRRREFLADAGSAMLTRQPSGLISALRKISADPQSLQAANKATASLYIVNPFKGKEALSWLAKLFDTHPPIEERIKALEAME